MRLQVYYAGEIGNVSSIGRIHQWVVRYVREYGTASLSIALRSIPDKALRIQAYHSMYACCASVIHSLTLLHIAPFHCVQIPQDSFHGPDKALFGPPGLAFFHGDEVLDERHIHIRADASENVPPTMQLKEETPGKSNRALKGRDVVTEAEVDVPEEVPEKSRRYSMSTQRYRWRECRAIYIFQASSTSPKPSYSLQTSPFP
jgi:hypothetical protein